MLVCVLPMTAYALTNHISYIFTDKAYFFLKKKWKSRGQQSNQDFSQRAENSSGIDISDN